MKEINGLAATAAVRSATNLRSISRISGSVVRSAASAHFLAWRRYLAASELMERLVSMSIVGSHTCGGRCLTLDHSMPWFGHTVQNRDTAHDVWRAMLHISNGRYGLTSTCGVLFNEGATNPQPAFSVATT